MSAKRFLADTRGSSAVEFALTAPAFIIVCLAIFAAGWAFHTAQSIRHELTQAARSLQLNPSMTASQLQTMVRDGVKIGTQATGNINVSLVTDAVVAGTQLAHATATFPLFLSVPFIEDLPITYSVTMTVAVKAS